MRMLVAACIAAASLAGCAAVSETPPFRPTVEAHLAAISARNMDALLPTLTTGEDLTMIAPNGYRWETRQQYVDFHRQWFATPDQGKLAYEIVDTVESPALSHALIQYRYSSKDIPEAQASPAWLALTFALEEGAWRLVFDQNTGIAPDAAR
jgi:hypothetical protein